MARFFLAALLITLPFIPYQVLGGGKDKNDNLCIRGKWVISSVTYERSGGIIILQAKKAKAEAEKLSKLLEGGTITFIEGEKVEFIPENDTTVFHGKLSIRAYSERQPAGMDRNGNTMYRRGIISEELQVRFVGKGAKYNFVMDYKCPKKNSSDEFKGKNFVGYIAYKFTRIVE